MNDTSDRLDAIEAKRGDMACEAHENCLRSEFAYLLDLARKQQAALVEVEEWLKNLDAIEEVDPTTPTHRNVSAAGVASAIRAAVKSTLEAKP